MSVIYLNKFSIKDNIYNKISIILLLMLKNVGMLTLAEHFEQHFGLLYFSHCGRHWPSAALSMHSVGHSAQHSESSFQSWHSGKH